MTRPFAVLLLTAACATPAAPVAAPSPVLRPSTSSGTGQVVGKLPKPVPLATRRPVRASRSREGLRWADSSKARRVAACESGGDIHAVSASGTYRGKWQMDADFWHTYGGLRYASRPELATEAQQDTVAHAGWLARGWQPWTCGRA